MTTELAPAAEAGELERLRTLDTPALLAALTAGIRDYAQHLLRLAVMWAELERRGEDLSDLRSGVGQYLPAIAAGTVLPDTVVRFAGNPTLLRHAARLTPEEQRRLLDGDGVPLVVRVGDAYTHRVLPARALTATQVRQVIGERAVRGVPEQIALLTAAPAAPPKAGRPVKRGRVRADRATNTVRVGKVAVPVADVVAALADMRHPQDDAELDAQVVVGLTAEEKRRLAHAAVDGDTTQQALARNALRQAGLI